MKVNYLWFMYYQNEIINAEKMKLLLYFIIIFFLSGKEKCYWKYFGKKSHMYTQETLNCANDVLNSIIKNLWKPDDLKCCRTFLTKRNVTWKIVLQLDMGPSHAFAILALNLMIRQDKMIAVPSPTVRMRIVKCVFLLQQIKTHNIHKK